MKKIMSTTKDFVLSHKKALIVTTGLTAVILVQRSGINSLNEFLKENNLFDTYYKLED